MSRTDLVEVVPQSDEFVVQELRIAKAGVEHDPTSDTVQFLVNTTGASPTAADGDWTTGAWDTFLSGTPVLAMIDPTDLSMDDDTIYYLFIKIIDTTETAIIRHIGFVRPKSSW